MVEISYVEYCNILILLKSVSVCFNEIELNFYNFVFFFDVSCQIFLICSALCNIFMFNCVLWYGYCHRMCFVAKRKQLKFS